MPSNMQFFSTVINILNQTKCDQKTNSSKMTLYKHHQSAPLPKREVSTRSGSYVVDLLDPNEKKLPEREVRFL